MGQDMRWLVRKIFPTFVARGLLRGSPKIVRLLRRALKMVSFRQACVHQKP